MPVPFPKSAHKTITVGNPISFLSRVLIIKEPHKSVVSILINNHLDLKGKMNNALTDLQNETKEGAIPDL